MRRAFPAFPVHDLVVGAATPAQGRLIMFVTVRTPDGETHRLEALEGWRVMEVIRDWGIPIKAECGGARACAPCPVWGAEDWREKVRPPLAEELESLAGAPPVA